MIIYGHRTCESPVGEGAFECPCCRTRQVYRHVVYKRWFTLYFIPIFPLGHVGEQVHCQGCFSRFGPEALFAAGANEPLMATVVDERGRPPQTLMAQPTHALQPLRPPDFGPPDFGPPLTQPQGTSPLAITSLILGLLSPFLLCAFGLSLLSSLGAIITGHLALMKIKRAPAPLAGNGQAITGLVFGYLFLVASIGVWATLGPAIYEAWQRDQQAGVKGPQSNSDRLLSAEMRVLAVGTEGVATGNTPAAKELAEDYAADLQKLMGSLFTIDGKATFSLTDGKFVVHCELHPGRCAFIVHVPSYRDFTGEAKSLLESNAWKIAQLSVAGDLKPGDSLALGLRGTVRYGAILEDTVGNPNENGFRRIEREALLAYFPPADLDLPEVPPPVLAEQPPQQAVVAAPVPNPSPSPSPSAQRQRDLATNRPPAGFGQPPPGFGPPTGFVPPPGFVAPPGGMPSGFQPPGFPPPGFAPPVPPGFVPASPMAKAGPTPGSPTDGSPKPAESLDEIVELIKSGPPTFARLYSPLHKLRDIEPDPARREEVAELLNPLLTTENSSVRRAAQDAVKVWGTQRNIPTLLALVDSRENSDRSAAMETLGKLSDSKEVAEKLASQLLVRGDSLRARRALEAMGPVAEDAVLPIVGNGDNLIHSYACQVLGKVGTSKSLVKLKALRKETDAARQASIDSAICNLDQRLKLRP